MHPVTIFLVRIFKLNIGLVLFAFGVVIALHAQIGLSPWDVLHSGFAAQTHIPIGISIILIGVIIGAIIVFMGEKIGIGTLSNMFFVGLYVQMLTALNVVPYNLEQSIIVGALFLLTGTLLIAIGSYYYIASGFGAGPRDSLMVLLSKKTGWKIGWCRYVVEAFTLAVGVVLGGSAGIGTVFSIIFISMSVQVVFKIVDFNPSIIQHETLKETLFKIKNYYQKKTV